MTMHNSPKPMSLSAYKKAKLNMLENDFLIKLTDDEKNDCNSRATEAAVDRFCRTILARRFGD